MTEEDVRKALENKEVKKALDDIRNALGCDPAYYNLNKQFEILEELTDYVHESYLDITLKDIINAKKNGVIVKGKRMEFISMSDKNIWVCDGYEMISFSIQSYPKVWHFNE